MKSRLKWRCAPLALCAVLMLNGVAAHAGQWKVHYEVMPGSVFMWSINPAADPEFGPRPSQGDMLPWTNLVYAESPEPDAMFFQTYPG